MEEREANIKRRKIGCRKKSQSVSPIGKESKGGSLGDMSTAICYNGGGRGEKGRSQIRYALTLGGIMKGGQKRLGRDVQNTSHVARFWGRRASVACTQRGVHGTRWRVMDLVGVFVRASPRKTIK